MSDTRGLTTCDRLGIQLDVIGDVLAYALNQRACFDEETPEYTGLAKAAAVLKVLYTFVEEIYREAQQA